MKFRRLYLLPGLLCLFVMATILVTYIIAVMLDHVVPDFPYISDTGTVSPESCVFSQFLNIAALILLATVYVRYLQVEVILQRLGAHVDRLPHWLNLMAAIFGCVSCLGLDVVANFQETHVLIVHLLGAFGCFCSASIYFCLQTYISRQLMKEVTTLLVYIFRLIISVACVVLTIAVIACGILSVGLFEGSDKKKWRPENGGWELHLTSTISEWLLVLCFCGFIVSYTGEFRGLVLDGPVLRVAEPDSDDGDSTQVPELEKAKMNVNK